MAIINLSSDDDIYGLVEFFVSATVPTSNARGKQFANVFHFRRFDGSGPPTKSSLVTGFLGLVANGSEGFYSKCLASDDSIVFTAKCRFPLDPFDAYGGDQTVSTSGGIAGDRLPTVNCATVQIHTGVRGRSFKGSKHFGPIAEADTTQDQLSSAALADHWVPAASFISTNQLAADDTVGAFHTHYLPCVLSRKDSQLLILPTTGMVADATTFTVNAAIGTVRHRSETRRGAIPPP